MGTLCAVSYLSLPEAIQEARDILDVNKQIIHSRYGRPTIASDQDETSGAYLLTFPNKSGISRTWLTYQRLQQGRDLIGTLTKTDGYVYFSKKALTEMLSLVYTRDDAGNLTYVKNIPDPDYKKCTILGNQ